VAPVRKSGFWKKSKKSCDKEKMHNYKNAEKKKKNDNLLEKVAVKLVKLVHRLTMIVGSVGHF
jgi:hypothetical protein